MKGSQKVVDYLNFLIGGELGARDQYFIHAQMYQEWHYLKLHARMAHEMEEETDHAKALINRVLMLESTPNMRVEPIHVGHDVPSMLKADLELEYKVRQHLKDGIALCEQEHDYVTREILVAQLIDTEEDHAHWLEQQLRLIDMIGLPNYLQSQLGDIDN
ncbi:MULTISPECIES: bacterioferritin [unclassified Moraxella]|uniref:bacterioferritin n=1 Tax=unclassified Moraxella TaxID=2685852 RepID=UPI003AF7FCCE